ncbi:MAG: hypothetical protein WCL50_11145 [Spirochaetota bacterium]
MKRILTLLLTLAVFASLATAQATTPMSLTVKDARSIGMGGAFISLASGYQSLYGNPAGFGVGRGMLTLANTSVWAYVKPTTQNINELTSLTSGTNDQILDKVNQLITGNGIGLGAAVGLGFTGGGLGLGVTAVTEEYARGNTLLGTSFTSATQISAVAGLAITLGPKDFNVKIGGDLRPFLRVEGAFPAFSLVSAMATGGDLLDVIMKSSASYGVGLAVDLGAMATMGSLSAGLSIRDIAPPFSYANTTFGDAIGYNGGSVTVSANDPKAQFIPDISLGVGWSPKVFPGLVDPSIYAEMQDPLGALSNKASIWNMVHVGGELKLLSFIYLRGGLNKGWLSAGGGIDLLILQADVALFTDELGQHPGDKPRSGVAANVRLHF